MIENNHIFQVENGLKMLLLLEFRELWAYSCQRLGWGLALGRTCCSPLLLFVLSRHVFLASFEASASEAKKLTKQWRDDHVSKKSLTKGKLTVFSLTTCPVWWWVTLHNHFVALANISKHPNSQRLCVTLKVSEIHVMKALNDLFRFHGPPSLSEAHNMAPRVCADIGEEANMGWSFQVSKNDSVCPAYAGPSFVTFFEKKICEHHWQHHWLESIFVFKSSHGIHN